MDIRQDMRSSSFQHSGKKEVICSDDDEDPIIALFSADCCELEVILRIGTRILKLKIWSFFAMYRKSYVGEIKKDQIISKFKSLLIR